MMGVSGRGRSGFGGVLCARGGKQRRGGGKAFCPCTVAHEREGRRKRTSRGTVDGRETSRDPPVHLTWTGWRRGVDRGLCGTGGGRSRIGYGLDFGAVAFRSKPFWAEFGEGREEDWRRIGLGVHSLAWPLAGWPW